MPSGISRRRPTSARQTTVIAPATAENAAESDLHAETATDNALNGSRGMQVEPLLSEADNIAIKIDEERDAIDILASQAAHRADGMVPSSTCEMDELLDLDISPAEGPLITPFANEDIVENTAIEQGLSNIAPHDVSSPVARPPSSSPLTALLDSHSTSEKPQLPFFRTPKGLDEWFNDRLEGSWEHEMSQFDRKSR